MTVRPQKGMMLTLSRPGHAHRAGDEVPVKFDGIPRPWIGSVIHAADEFVTVRLLRPESREKPRHRWRP